MLTGNSTTNVLFEVTTDCVTDCQLADTRFVVDINCQFGKLVGHENRKVAGGTLDIDSVGDTASAAHTIAETHKTR